MTKIASLGCADCRPPAPSNRKFMMPLDVVEQTSMASYVILVGSGDREKPLMGFDDAYSVDNYFFKIVGPPTDRSG